MSEEIPIRYAVSIAVKDDIYYGIIYLPASNEYARCSNKNLTKLMNLVSSRIRKKELELKKFPLPERQEEEGLIVLPNGRI